MALNKKLIFKKNSLKGAFYFFWRNRLAGILIFLILVSIFLFSFESILEKFNQKKLGYVPDVEGWHKNEATKYLESLGFSVFVKYIDYVEGCDTMSVHSTYPRSPQKINKNRALELNIYSKKSDVIVENYTGLTEKEARELAQKNKLKLEVFTYISDIDPLNIVSSQEPRYKNNLDSYTYIKEGDTIRVDICTQRTPGKYIVPDVVGLSLNQAIKDLTLSGFSIADTVHEVVDDNILEDTVYKISYINNNGYEIELFEEEIFTVPFKVYITVFKNSKKGS